MVQVQYHDYDLLASQVWALGDNCNIVRRSKCPHLEQEPETGKQKSHGHLLGHTPLT